MDDPACVGSPERLSELDPESDRLLDGERPGVEPLAESPARDERHEEPGPVGRGAGVEEIDEALLLSERAEQAPLAFEAREGPRVRLEEELERGGAPVGHAGAVDDAHGSPAELSQDLVGAELHGATMASTRPRRHRLAL